MRGLWRLAWLEVKIFIREPLGVFGTLVPALMFVIVGRIFGSQMRGTAESVQRTVGFDVPILASLMIALSAVLSLVAIIAIYREGGILKRLRATPLQPLTILTAHVLVKLVFTLVTLAAMLLVGRRYYPADTAVPVVSFALAFMFTTVTILSLGFLIASVVPTARFAQPLGSLILYPMLGICGLFAPVDAMPPTLRLIARVIPLTYATSLLRGIWRGESWSAHAVDIGVLALMFALFCAVSAKVFRWE